MVVVPPNATCICVVPILWHQKPSPWAIVQHCLLDLHSAVLVKCWLVTDSHMTTAYIALVIDVISCIFIVLFAFAPPAIFIVRYWPFLHFLWTPFVIKIWSSLSYITLSIKNLVIWPLLIYFGCICIKQSVCILGQALSWCSVNQCIIVRQWCLLSMTVHFDATVSWTFRVATAVRLRGVCFVLNGSCEVLNTVCFRTCCEATNITQWQECLAAGSTCHLFLEEPFRGEAVQAVSWCPLWPCNDQVQDSCAQTHHGSAAAGRHWTTVVLGVPLLTSVIFFISYDNWVSLLAKLCLFMEIHSWLAQWLCCLTHKWTLLYLAHIYYLTHTHQFINHFLGDFPAGCW